MADDPKKISGCEQVLVEDIRHMILDRLVEDNMIDLDLTFSDEEILNAYRHAANKYNSIHPRVGNPGGVYTFGSPHVRAMGVIYMLYLSAIQRMSRNVVSYESGGVTVNQDQQQLEYMKQNAAYYREEFETGSVMEKKAANMSQGYGIF